MNFSVISIFPGILKNFISYGLIAKAIENKIINIDVYDLRDFSKNKHRKVDDRPFGGGAGMVLMPQPLFDAIHFIKKNEAEHPTVTEILNNILTALGNIGI